MVTPRHRNKEDVDLIKFEELMGICHCCQRGFYTAMRRGIDRALCATDCAGGFAMCDRDITLSQSIERPESWPRINFPEADQMFNVPARAFW